MPSKSSKPVSSKDSNYYLPFFYFDPFESLKNAVHCVRTDLSSQLLLLSNIVFIIFALTQKLSVEESALAFACQGLVLGYFYFIKYFLFTITGPNDSEIMSLDKTNSIPRLFSPKHKITYDFRHKAGWAIFFLVHYNLVGAFVAGGSFFLIMRANEQLLAIIIFFFVTHLISFLMNLNNDLKKEWSLGEMLLLPYLRILPIYLSQYVLIFVSLLFVMGYVFLISITTGKVGALPTSEEFAVFGAIFWIIIFFGVKSIIDINAHSFTHSRNQPELINSKDISLKKTLLIGGAVTLVFLVLLVLLNPILNPFSDYSKPKPTYFGTPFDESYVSSCVNYNSSGDCSFDIGEDGNIDLNLARTELMKGNNGDVHFCAVFDENKFVRVGDNLFLVKKPSAYYVKEYYAYYSFVTSVLCSNGYDLINGYSQETITAGHYDFNRSDLDSWINNCDGINSYLGEAQKVVCFLRFKPYTFMTN